MFNNPYLYQNFTRPSLFSRLFRSDSNSMFTKGLNWSNILANTQKSLGIINQAIPLVYQVKPIVNNAKTMFKIANAVNSKENISKETITNKQPQEKVYNKPIFYI